MTMQLLLSKLVPKHCEVCLGIYLQGEPNYYISYILEGETIVYVDHDLPLHVKTLVPLVIDGIIGKSYTELSQRVSTYNLIYS